MSPLDTNTTGLKVKQKWGQCHCWTLTLQGQKTCGAQRHYWARINAGAMTPYRAGDVCACGGGGGEGVTTTGPDDIGSGGQDCAWVKAAHGSSLYMLQGCTEVTDVQGSRLCPWVKAVHRSRLCSYFPIQCSAD